MTLFAQVETSEDMEMAAREAGQQAVDSLGEFLDRLTTGDYFGFVILGCIASAVVVGSGALSSSIAEGRLRGRQLHFLLGMLMPVIYPVLALFVLPRKTYEKEEATEMRMMGNAAETASDDEYDTQSALNYDFFHASMFDTTGNPRGPFIMVVDNVELRVERIAEVMPKIVVLETVNSDGNLQTMRLPFGRISSCREI
jgi:hypothetical protein